MRAQIGTLIIATSGVQLANSFFGTFISLRVAMPRSKWWISPGAARGCQDGLVKCGNAPRPTLQTPHKQCLPR